MTVTAAKTIPSLAIADIADADVAIVIALWQACGLTRPWNDPAADIALFNALKSNLRTGIEVIEIDCAINDPPFAEACANTLLKNILQKSSSSSSST